MLGVLEGILIGSIGIGGLLAPLLIHVAGIRWALILTGLLLPVLALAATRRLLSIDRRTSAPAHTDLLRGIELLAPLPLATLEALAGSLAELSVPAGDRDRARGRGG